GSTCEEYKEFHNRTQGKKHEALEMAVKALEKQTPKKPETARHITGHCSNCLEILHGNWKYCACCGQAIDWEDK
ncbi:MAG: hypothetical protein Q4B26_02065, partial [Eubacteriales bacterium]|nr:hypothetical protein [Eubacteriales bacterium]